MKKLFALLGAACSMQSAQAAPVWIYATKVEQIYAASGVSTTFVLAFSTDSPTCASPQSPKYYYVKVGQNGVTETSAKNILAIAMMAMSLDKEVAVLFDNGTSYCYTSAIRIQN